MVKSLNQENGFTLIEVLVAQVVLITGALAISGVFVAGSRFNAESEDRTVAVNIAQYVMEETIEDLIDTYFEDVVGTGVVEFDSAPQGPPYWTLNAAEEWIPSLPEGTYAVSYPDGVGADPLRIMVTVSWQGHTPRNSSISLQTLVSKKQ